MTSPRYLAPKVTHSRVTNHLYVFKKPYVNPNTANGSTSRNPLAKSADERRRAKNNIPQRT